MAPGQDQVLARGSDTADKPTLVLDAARATTAPSAMPTTARYMPPAAVPLVVEPALPPASLVLVLNAARYRTTDLDTVIQIACEARDRIVRTLAAGDGLRLGPATLG